MRRATTLGLIGLLALAQSTAGIANSRPLRAAFPAVFRPTFHTLWQASMPVYLPTWLLSISTFPFPKGSPLTPGGWLSPSGHAYKVTLWADGRGSLAGNQHCGQCGRMFVAGRTGTPAIHAWTLPVRLANGSWAYITAPAPRGYYGGSCCSTVLDWPIYRGLEDGATYTEYDYTIGGQEAFSNDQLVRMANSLTRLFPPATAK